MNKISELEPQEILDSIIYVADFASMFSKQAAQDALDEREYADAASNFYKAYESALFLSYIDYVDSKPASLKQEYVEYLFQQSETVGDDRRDDNRYPSKEDKEELPGTCGTCGGDKDIEYHHIIPHSCGGDTSVENLAPLCSRCHSKIPPIEFGFAKHGLIEDAVKRASDRRSGGAVGPEVSSDDD